MPDGVREARARQQDVQRAAGLRQQVQVNLQRLAGRHQTSGNGRGSSGKQLTASAPSPSSSTLLRCDRDSDTQRRAGGLQPHSEGLGLSPEAVRD